MCALPPKHAFILALSMRRSPPATTRKAWPPTAKVSILAICPGATPCWTAASATLALAPGVSMIARSGAACARCARTEARPIAQIL